MKQITLQNKNLPDVRGTVEQVGESFTLLLPKFWNTVPEPWRAMSEPDAMAQVNSWIDWMNRELGYTIKSVKEIPDVEFLTHSMLEGQKSRLAGAGFICYDNGAVKNSEGDFVVKCDHIAQEGGR